MYTVIAPFADLADNNFIYGVGDKYPRAGFVASEARINELKSANNLRGYPLIRAVNAAKTVSTDEPKEQHTRARKTANKGNSARNKG